MVDRARGFERSAGAPSSRFESGGSMDTSAMTSLLGDPMPAHAERLEEGLRGLWEELDVLGAVRREELIVYLHDPRLTTPAEALLLTSLIDTQRELVRRVGQLGTIFEAAVQHIVAE